MTDQDLHREWWQWIFSTPNGPNHPLRGNAVKRASSGEYLLAGTIKNQRKGEQHIKIPAGSRVFVPAANCLCTAAEKDPQPLDTNCAQSDINNIRIGDCSVTINGTPQQIRRIGAHRFSLDVKEIIPGTATNGQGVPKGPTEAGADGYYAIFQMPQDAHTIVITSPGINVTYKIP